MVTVRDDASGFRHGPTYSAVINSADTLQIGDLDETIDNKRRRRK
jgi:hypothetical protein